jgi:CRISPR/Cas system-associated exonuclease Cas4 (RecB family)
MAYKKDNIEVATLNKIYLMFFRNKLERMVLSKNLKIRPSELRKFAYCPLLIFYSEYMRLRPTIKLRLRSLIGNIFHFFHHLIRFRWLRERIIRLEIPELKAFMVGKPDTYKFVGNVIVIEEFKSRKSPKFQSHRTYKGAWLSDALQAMAYAYILKRIYDKDTLIKIRYIDKSIDIPYDEELLFSYIYRLKLVKEGMFPEPEWITRNKCRYCQYRDFCPFSPYNDLSLD